MKSFLQYLKASYIELLVGCGAIAVLTIISLFLTDRPAVGAGVPSNGGLPGIYNTTGTDLVLRNGYGSSLAVDSHGRIIISTDSSLNKLSIKYVSSTAIDATRYVSTTRLFVESGTNASPAIAWSLNKDMGFYRTSNNNIGVASQGTERMTIGSNGVSVRTTIYPAVANTYLNGQLATPWLNTYSTNVSSTRGDFIGYVSTTKLYVGNIDAAGNYVPRANNTYDIGSATKAIRNIYASGTYMGVNLQLSGNATTSIATGRYELGRQGDVGSPFTWWNMYLSAGVAGTRNKPCMTVGDLDYLCLYAENSGTAQHPQNPGVEISVPIKHGRPNATTYNYYWTTDGCQAELRTNSSTAPTYAATSTAFCP